MFRAQAIFALTLGIGCGDDGGSSDESTGDGSTSMQTTGGATNPSTSASTTADESSTGSSSDEASTTDEPSSSGSADSSSSGEVDDGTYAALVRGTMFTSDLAEAQAFHDMLAMGGERAAMALGDFGHTAVLGTTLLGTAENQYVALDQWDNLAGAQTLYGDPEFAEPFGMFFAEPPSLELFRLRDDWYGWGSPESGDASDPHWFVVVRGRLAEADVDAAQAFHDPFAMGGEETAMSLGDVAHVVWLGVEDEREFFALDVWTDDANIEAFYGDPAFIEAAGQLLEGQPSVGVYRSTDWHQW